MGDKKKNIFRQTAAIRKGFSAEHDHYVILKYLFWLFHSRKQGVIRHFKWE